MQSENVLSSLSCDIADLLAVELTQKRTKDVIKLLRISWLLLIAKMDQVGIAISYKMILGVGKLLKSKVLNFRIGRLMTTKLYDGVNWLYEQSVCDCIMSLVNIGKLLGDNRTKMMYENMSIALCTELDRRKHRV